MDQSGFYSASTDRMLSRELPVDRGNLAKPICEPLSGHHVPFYFVTCCREMDKMVHLLSVSLLGMAWFSSVGVSV